MQAVQRTTTTAQLQAADVRFVSAKESRLAEVRHQGLLPSAEGYAASGTWFKLCLPDLLPDGLQRVLCMDCDMLALTNLQPLLDQTLQGKRYAAR